MKKWVDKLLLGISPKTETVFLEGIVGTLGFEAMLGKGAERLSGKNLVVKDPIKLLVSGSPLELKGWMAKFVEAGIHVMVERQVRLRLITINPFYPQYRYATHDYEAAYVDKEKLKELMQSRVRGTGSQCTG